MFNQPKCPNCGKDSTYWKFNHGAPKEREIELRCYECGENYFYHDKKYTSVKTGVALGMTLGVAMIVMSLIMMF